MAGVKLDAAHVPASSELKVRHICGSRNFDEQWSVGSCESPHAAKTEIACGYWLGNKATRALASMMPATHFLLSMDLEDPRDSVPNGLRYPERVSPIAERLLTLIREVNAKVTFFVTGPVVKRATVRIHS